MVNERESGYRLLLSEMLLEEDALLRDVPRISVAESPKPALGGIHLLGKLGQGGMGSVYLGWHTRLETEVAVKVLPPYLARRSSEAVQRFLREARLAARIQSPHLVGVRDVNEENGYHFIVMEYVQGISAGKYVDDFFEATGEGLPEEKALEIVAAANEGMVAAHANGVVHRDIKPDNILIPRDPHDELRTAAAKLADLGLARPSGFGQKLTEEGFVVGTPGFLSPEQASDARSAGKPADVFGMGATLYALLTGKAPFDGDTSVNALVASITRDPKPLSELRPDVSPATLALVNRCLEKKPEQRFADAAVLNQALTLCRSALGKGRSEQEQACAALRKLPGAPKANDPQASIETIARIRPAPAHTRRMRPALAACIAAIVLLGCVLGYLLLPSNTASDPEDLKALALSKNTPSGTSPDNDPDRGRPRPPSEAQDPDRLALSGRSYWLPPAADNKPGNPAEAARRAHDEKLPHPFADRNSEMPYRLELWSGERKAPLYARGRELLAVLEPDQPFSIHLANLSGGVAAVALYLDGENTFAHETLPPSQTLKWVLKPGQSTDIRGWQKDRVVAEEFVFKAPEAAGTATRPSRLTAVVYREQAKLVTRDSTQQKEILSSVTETKVDRDPVPAAVLNLRLVPPAEVEGLTPLP